MEIEGGAANLAVVAGRDRNPVRAGGGERGDARPARPEDVDEVQAAGFELSQTAEAVARAGERLERVPGDVLLEQSSGEMRGFVTGVLEIGDEGDPADRVGRMILCVHEESLELSPGPLVTDRATFCDQDVN